MQFEVRHFDKYMDALDRTAGGHNNPFNFPKIFSDHFEIEGTRWYAQPSQNATAISSCNATGNRVKLYR